jgi:quercetin dioxygenase-like cupin family protein
MHRCIQRAMRIALIGLATLPRAVRSQSDAGFGRCVPRAQRGADRIGCFIVVDQPVGELAPAQAYWHIARFGTRQAAIAARPPNGAVIEAFDRVWLMVIGTRDWRPHSGTPVATIGPLPITPGTAYSAVYMEASMRPGMKSAIHRHAGPEAWYTISGQTCLETPKGTSVGRAGGRPVIIPEGVPMELTATGTGTRQSLVLILHDSRKPATTPEKVWVPRGACR